jgi:hypothetical protein
MAKLTDVAEGLLILEKYNPGSHDIAACHDIICAGPSEVIVEGTEDDDEPKGTVVSAEDAKRLHELGWHIDSENECWARFV